MSGDLVPPGYLGFAPGFVLLLGVLGVGWAGWVLSLFARARGLARAQEHESAMLRDRAKWVLAEGPSRVVRGRVEVDGDAPAIEIDVWQRVADCTSKNTRWHEWRESWRRAAVRPFRLAREDGQTVLVEPHEDVLVVDSLATDYPIDRPRERVRSAVVRAGEEIYVHGDLVRAGGEGGAYRGGASFTLVAPRRARMLVATDAVQGRYAARIRFSRRAGLWTALVFCAFHAIFTTPFLAAMLFGVREEATLVRAYSYYSQSKHGPVLHEVIRAETRDGLVLTSEVAPDDYAEAQHLLATTDAPKVTVLRVGNAAWASYVGPHPYVHFGVFVFAFFAVGISWILVKAFYPRTFPWYDQKRVNEHGGPGHWVETRTSNGLGPAIDPTRN